MRRQSCRLSSASGARARSDEPRLSVKDLALSLPGHAWRTITWRKHNERLRSRFARVGARRANQGAANAPKRRCSSNGRCEAEPTKYWLATIDQKMPFRDLVDIVKMRWRIERDYQDLKKKSGSDITKAAAGKAPSHGTLSIAAYDSPHERSDSPLRTVSTARSKNLPSQWLRPAAPPIRPQRTFQTRSQRSGACCRRDRTNHATMPHCCVLSFHVTHAGTYESRISEA